MSKPKILAAAGVLAIVLVAILAPVRSLLEGAVSKPSEAAGWLRDYLRIDTSNPPGGERPAAELLAGILHREGIETELIVTGENRASIYARLPGRDRGEALLLMHHLDVVPPGPGWTAAPFAGEISDGRIRGRGAIDSKSLGVAQMAALIELKRRGEPLARDVIFLAVADEESGGTEGTARLLAERPELFEGVSAVFNEGGSNRTPPAGLLWWGVEVAQKRPFWLEVRAGGRGGHGSGFNPHSASHKLISALGRFLALEPRWRVDPEVRDYLHALAPLHNDVWREKLLNIADLVTPEGLKTGLFPGMANLFLDSAQITVVEVGERINVIPETARARLDVRLLPGTDADAYLARVREAMGPNVRIEVLLTSPPAAPSPTGTRLFRALEKVLGEEAPIVPAFISGLTDSRYFRSRGIPAYGISPFVLGVEDLKGIHGPDEGIPLVELDRGVERVVRIVEAYALGE